MSLLALAPQAGFLAAAGFLGVASGSFAISTGLGRIHSDCGCFSAPHAVDARFFVRNALLGGVALVGWYWGPVGEPVFGGAGAIAMVVVATFIARRSENVSRDRVPRVGV